MKDLHKVLLLFILSIQFNTGCADSGGSMTIDKTLNNALGDKKSYVTGADEVFIARLEVGAVTTAQQRALQDRETITGYSISGKKFRLNHDEVDRVTVDILNDNNYSHQRIRCKNEYLIGIKYSGGNKIVDFSLGMPCQQVIWAYPSADTVVFWSANLNDAVTKKVLDLYQLKIQ